MAPDITHISTLAQELKMNVNKDKEATLSKWTLVLLLVAVIELSSARVLTKRSFADHSVKGYLTERTCWWNEVCKEEFQSLFRCKCPTWSFCAAPGRYYNAYCSMAATGYIWTQPGLEDAS